MKEKKNKPTIATKQLYIKMSSKQVCKYFKYGYCKFTDKCRNLHNTKICDKTTCDVKMCNFRHPKTCKFHIEFQHCKFGEWCLYRHKDNHNHMSDKEIENLV